MKFYIMCSEIPTLKKSVFYALYDLLSNFIESY